MPSIFEAPKDLKSREEVIQWLLKWSPPSSSPPKYAYSNVGIALIGFVLENVYHRDWETLLTEKILSPERWARLIRMSLLIKKIESRKAMTLSISRQPFFQRAGFSIPRVLSSRVSADLGAYLASWDEGFFRYLKESVCFANHACQGLGIEAHPLGELLTGDFTNTRFTTQSLDSFIMKEERLPPLNQILIDKTGSSDGMSAYIVMVPSTRQGVVVLCNLRNVEERVSLGRKILGVLQQKQTIAPH